MLPAFVAGPAIERGEIVQLLDDYAIPEAGLYIVRPPPADPVPHKIRVLTDIMLEKFGGSDWDGCLGAGKRRSGRQAAWGPAVEA